MQPAQRVGVVHHTGWDDLRERGSSRQRQALDVVMQIKDQRITNVKQKFGPNSSRSCSPSRRRRDWLDIRAVVDRG